MSTVLKNYVPCGCKAIINDKDPRAGIWMAVFGCLEFPLKHPIPKMGMANGEVTASFLEGDWASLSEDQKVKLCLEMKKKFPGLKDSEFVSQTNALGYIPIKDINVSVWVCQLHTRMMQ